MQKQLSFFISLLVILFASGCTSRPANEVIILATTTSTQDSGLLDVLVPTFEEKSGYTVKTVAVGTGQALKMGEEGNADVLLVHAPQAEAAFMQGGYGSERRLVMHNDFVIIGPAADSAGILDSTSAVDALTRIASAQASFVSRGDDSGTHKMELTLWEQAGITPGGDWYIESGQGMGATLFIASEKSAYTLTDRATFLAIRQNLFLDILLEGDPVLLNIYHVITVNGNKWPAVNAAGAAAFADFITSPEGQAIIRTYGMERYGQPLFIPDAGKSETELFQP